MKLTISDARSIFNSVGNLLRVNQIIYVTRHGNNVFALVALDYLDTVTETIEIMSDPASMRLLQESLKEIKAGRVHEHDDVERELG